MSKASKSYLESQYGKLSEEIKKAYLAGQNIVYVITKDYAIVKEAIDKNPIFFINPKAETEVVGTNVNSHGTKTEENKTSISQNLFFGIESLNFNNSAPKGPSIFVVTLKSYQATDQVPSKLNTYLKNFSDNLASLSNIGDNMNFKKSLVIIVSPFVVEVPEEIALYSRIIRVEEPTENEIQKKIASLVHDLDGIDLESLPGNTEYIKQLYNSTKGLSLHKITQIFSRIKYELDRVYFPVSTDEFKELNRILLEEKSKLVENSAILKLVKTSKSIKKTSGMSSLENWLEERKNIVSDPDKILYDAFIPQPKGILLSGIPGTGKSLAAKTTASTFNNLPLLQIDMGNIMDKFQGESEHKMEEALKLTEALSPCVLWIDEVEKGIAGASGGTGSSESMKRIFGKLLTWMQEKEERGVCCFVFATANSISSIPPELFRSGRFDEKFYTFLPSWRECIEIFKNQISAQSRSYNKYCEQNGLTARKLFDDDVLRDSFLGSILESNVVLTNRPLSPQDKSISKDYKFMTGSDIESIIQRAKLIVFNSHKISGTGSPIYPSDEFKKAIEQAITETRTYAQTNAKQIVECYAQLAEYNFVPVSGNEIVPFRFLNPSQDSSQPPFCLESEEVDKHLNKHLEHEYDRQLFMFVGIASNYYLGKKD